MKPSIGIAILCCVLTFLPTSGEASWSRLPISKKQAQQAMRARKFALVVGINQTQATYWSALKYAETDALRMGKGLQAWAQFDRILIRTGRSQTTRSALLQSLYALRKLVKSPKDTVFVYLSAHGTVAPSKAGEARYIVTSDTTNHIPQTGLAVTKVLSILKGFASRRIVLMLATCYTGQAQSKSRPMAGSKGPSSPKKPLSSRAIQILSATGFAQPAFESRRLGADVYTHFFLQCLHRLKRSQKNVSAIDVHACASKPTMSYVKRHRGAIQVPRADSQLGANRDVYLIQKEPIQRKKGYFWAFGVKGVSSYEVQPLLRAKGAGRSTPAMFATPGELMALRPGRYTVTLRDRWGRVRDRYSITVRFQGITSTPQSEPYEAPPLGMDPEDIRKRRQERRKRHLQTKSKLALGWAGVGLSSAFLVGGGLLVTIAGTDQVNCLSLCPNGDPTGTVSGAVLGIAFIAVSVVGYVASGVVLGSAYRDRQSNPVPQKSWSSVAPIPPPQQGSQMVGTFR